MAWIALFQAAVMARASSRRVVLVLKRMRATLPSMRRDLDLGSPPVDDKESARSRSERSALGASPILGAPLPPVFVMNPYYSGLGIARSLYGRGVRVYALAWERDAPGLRSRYFHGVHQVPNGRDEPERLLDRLLDIRSRHAERPVLFPTRDFDLLFLHEHRETLAPHYVLPQPEDSPILRMMDKFELATVARARGIPNAALPSGAKAALRLSMATHRGLGKGWLGKSAHRVVARRVASALQAIV